VVSFLERGATVRLRAPQRFADGVWKLVYLLGAYSAQASNVAPNLVEFLRALLANLKEIRSGQHCITPIDGM